MKISMEFGSGSTVQMGDEGIFAKVKESGINLEIDIPIDDIRAATSFVHQLVDGNVHPVIPRGFVPQKISTQFVKE